MKNAISFTNLSTNEVSESIRFNSEAAAEAALKVCLADAGMVARYEMVLVEGK